MSPVRKIEDVIEVAVRIERKGVEFYKKIYKVATVPEAREIFSFMVAEEEKHLGTFAKLLEKAADYNPRFKYPGRYETFLSDVANISLDVFILADEAAASGNVSQAIDVGIRMEKESIDFYEKLKENIDDPESGYVQEIIKEEQSHLNKLESLKKKS